MAAYTILSSQYQLIVCNCVFNMLNKKNKNFIMHTTQTYKLRLIFLGDFTWLRVVAHIHRTKVKNKHIGGWWKIFSAKIITSNKSHLMIQANRMLFLFLYSFGVHLLRIRATIVATLQFIEIWFSIILKKIRAIL